MDAEKRYLRIWKALYRLLAGYLSRRFGLLSERCELPGPCLIISNHATTWDPLLLAVSFPGKNIHFVASEHIFRLGVVSRLLCALMDPIPRRKGSGGADTVMMCLRKLTQGGSVCIFAEGEATWDGVSAGVFPATGKLARTSGITLVTYRLEGGYLSLPRWSRKLRRGQMRGHIVGVYPPERLKAMRPAEITELIDRDIYEDAWQRQRTEPVKYKGRAPAESLEQCLFMCPRCHRVDSLKSAGDILGCSCGLELRYTELGFFDPREPFETVRQWDLWQRERLAARDFPHGEELFSDTGLSLREIGARHRERPLCRGCLRQYEDRMDLESFSFPLTDISNMAMVKANILLFSAGDKYYELRASAPRCLRKYLEVWEQAQKKI